MNWIIPTIAVFAAACSFKGAPSSNIDSAPGDGDGDGDFDAAFSIDVMIPIDAPPPPNCMDWAPAGAHFDPCEIDDPIGGELQLNDAGTYTFNTDNNGTLMDPAGGNIAITTYQIQQGGRPALLVSTEAITVNSNSILRVIGARPLIIASWSYIDVRGGLDVGSTIEFGPGAGANFQDCMDPTKGTDSTSINERGGGGGGGFASGGGDGGNGKDNNPNSEGGEAGGAEAAPPTIVRGGCDGAEGGGPNGGTPGDGGGAVQLSAFATITISGIVQSRGGGGQTANTDLKGGGGGGSGGYIGLDAPRVDIDEDGRVYSTGGGGGEGNGQDQEENGEDGQLDGTAAEGGDAESDGGDGGDGSIDANPAQNGGTAGKGGGGGGGGSGFILVWSQLFTNNGSLVPAATEL